MRGNEDFQNSQNNYLPNNLCFNSFLKIRFRLIFISQKINCQQLHYDHRLTYTEEWKGRGYPGNGGRREEIKGKKNWFDMGPDWNHKNYFNSLTIQSIKQLTQSQTFSLKSDANFFFLNSA